MNFLDHTLRIYRLALALALGWMVAACGGGGGTASNDGGAIVTSSSLSPGIYTGSSRVQGTTSDNTWVTLLTADNKWYGWEFVGASEVALYLGDLSPSARTGSTTSIRAFKNGAARSGRISLVGVSSQGYTASAVLDSAPSLPEERQNAIASAAPVTGFAGLTSLAGSPPGSPWTGTWRDGSTRSAQNATLWISESGQITFSDFLNCQQSSQSSSVSPLAGVPAFSLELRFSALNASCHWVGLTLSGVLIVRNSQILDKTWEIDLLAVDSQGKSISFRASR